MRPQKVSPKSKRAAMSDNQYSSDSLYTNTNKFLLVLDSRNATTRNNDTYNCDLSFEFEEPIMIPRGALKLTCSVMAFTAPNSIYNINASNNYLHLKYGNANTDVKVYFPYGNYNSTTFMATFLTRVAYYDATLGTGLGITLNTITNQMTVSHTSQGIMFMYDSTIAPVIGLSNSYSSGFAVGGSSNVIFPYTCNFTGIQNINVHITNMNTDNIDSLTKSTSGIIQTVPVDSNQSQIIFSKTTDYAFTVKETVIDVLEILLTDDLGKLINWNNQHWNMTLYFSLVEDIERFKEDRSFRTILQTGYA